jgi:hypothetical protein
MWEYILTGLTVVSSISAGIYYYLNRYTDEVTELMTFIHNDIKTIKYMYRGKKYIYMTYNLEDNIGTIQKEIDINSTEKDNIPEVDYKYFKLIITTPSDCNKQCKNKSESVQNIEECDNCECDNCDCDIADCDNCESSTDNVHELLLEAPKLIYAFVGPANTYYFAFDKDFNKKLTTFMNYLFEDDKQNNKTDDKHEGALTYGRFSALLEPEKYFDFKAKINVLKKNNSTFEWILY